MATTYRIHPAIGVARVGNSPDEFFVGPERLGEFPEPADGFKDAQCRVKRQAARFRIFAHHDDGTTSEITAADADISWTVHIVNAKAAFTGRNNPEPAGDLTIDPGPRTLNAPNGRALFDTGTISFNGHADLAVPLGEVRTDDDGHLLVLGGAGHSASPAGNGISSFWSSIGWFDDVADGPVSATISLHGGGGTPSVEGAWVIVAPPKFAPHQDSVTTLYDRVLQQMIDSGLATAPTTTSYTHDVYPILQRARDMAWVEGVLSSHQWTHPITNQATIDAVMSRVANPTGGGGNMPPLNGSDHKLTPTQYAHLVRWQNGTYDQDWAGVPNEPNVSPEGADRAALDACAGGAFYPGIEAGGLSPGSRPILEAPYGSAFRLDHAQVAAGTITASMALPWQADFKACGDRWWPVPRPNTVLSAPGGPTVRWDRDVNSMGEMVSEWSSLGFVVRQGAEHIETQHCDEQSIVLLTPHLDFVDVGQGPMGMVREVPMAIVFEVVSPGTAVTLEYAPGGAPNHAQLVAIGSSVNVAATAANTVATARLWIVYRTDSVGSAIPTQTVTVRDPASGRSWQVTIDANTVARATTATAMALDRSGSMSEDRGDGQSKHVALQQAANLFVDLMLEGDGAGIARFDHNAQVLQNVLALGNGQLTDTNRSSTHDIINGNALDPAGATSIGDGIHEARGILAGATGYDHKALVVLTDGIENNPQWIRDVSADIDATTYAVGLGRPENISVPALQTVAGNHGGYMLVTGPITGDNRFRLQKHFLQILAGINNAEVVLDPSGTVSLGQVVSVPFSVSDADSGIEVVLLTPYPQVIDFRLQSPTGQLIEPWMAEHDPGLQFGISDGAAFFRCSLPVQLQPGRFDQAGTWHALLTIGRPRVGPDIKQTDPSIVLADRGRLATGIANPDRLRPAEMSDAERRFAMSRGELASHQPTASAANNRRTLPYSIVVHSYSSVSFRATVDQRSFAPGAEVAIGARLSQSGVAVDGAAVWAEVVGPRGEQFTIALDPTGSIDPTAYSGAFSANSPGVYNVRVRARGRTRAGVVFTREQTMTASVWHGAGQPGDPASEVPGGHGQSGGSGAGWCELLACLLGPDGVFDERARKRLTEQGIDLDRALKCLHHCRCDEHGSEDRK